MMPNPGRFITLEGLEGAGKTSAIEVISQVLHEAHIDDIIYTREPGGTQIAEQLRDLIKIKHPTEPLTDVSELLLFYAARSQLVETVIRPALAAGKWVIGDRHDLSTQAYQGAGRKLSPQLIQTLSGAVLNGFKPDLTLYLDVSPQIGLARARARGELDRIEQESIDFFERVRTQFLTLAAQDESIIVIDANLPIAEVTAEVKRCMQKWLRTLTTRY